MIGVLVWNVARFIRSSRVQALRAQTQYSCRRDAKLAGDPGLSDAVQR
jgi:hypothetical protein